MEEKRDGLLKVVPNACAKVSMPLAH